MKKLCLTLFLLLLLSFCYGESYSIKNVTYNISPCAWSFLGTTKTYCLEQNVSLNKEKVFESLEEVDEYIQDYKQRLHNLRAFESIEVTYTVLSSQKEVLPIEVQVTLVDSMHLLAIPYLKYDSNQGLIMKLKAKDTNFLGTLNPMSADFNVQFEQASENAEMNLKMALNFQYDYPFEAGIFDNTWVNDYGISYTIGDDLPEWSAKTGLKVVLPINKYALCFEAYQSSINNFDYEKFGDNIYFNEQLKISTPVELANITNWGQILYTPYLDFNYNWDFDKISNIAYNYDLSGPSLAFGHSVTTSRTNWKNNLRTGLDCSLTNTFTYNFDRNIIYPFISMETQAFKSFVLLDKNILKGCGICVDLLAFNYFINPNNPYRSYDGKMIGAKLRGIRDNQYYKGTDTYACKTISAIVLNMDFPIHIYTSNFNNKYLKYFNFDLQFSPFMDIALTNNKATEKLFDPKDGFYTAGLEALVYPKKFSSYVVRASLGYDIGRKFFSDYLNMDWRQKVSKYEISFGLGLHY